MLWKLADNVKYEDDCEVSEGKARTGKKVCRDVRLKLSFFCEFMSLERKKVKLKRKRPWKFSKHC